MAAVVHSAEKVTPCIKPLTNLLRVDSVDAPVPRESNMASAYSLQECSAFYWTQSLCSSGAKLDSKNMNAMELNDVTLAHGRGRTLFFNDGAHILSFETLAPISVESPFGVANIFRLKLTPRHLYSGHTFIAPQGRRWARNSAS